MISEQQFDIIDLNCNTYKTEEGVCLMPKDRRAHAVLFGFDFQVNAAIILMLENITDLKSLRLEGNFEDIELELTGKRYILAQAKSIEKASSDFRNVKANLKKALASLSDGSVGVDAVGLILITNSPNPLNDNKTRNIFYGESHRSFSSLPKSAQDLITGYLTKIKNPLNPNKFMIQTFPFETDDNLERYKVVKARIDDFIGSLGVNTLGLGNALMEIWHHETFTNGTKIDADIKLSKEDIVWPIIVLSSDISRCDNIFSTQFDPAEYDEIIRKYKGLIDSHNERFESFTKVLYDYSNFTHTGSATEKPLAFAFEKWPDYVSEFQVDNLAPDMREKLIQIILYSIVRNRISIDHIKRGVNL